MIDTAEASRSASPISPPGAYNPAERAHGSAAPTDARPTVEIGDTTSFDAAGASPPTPADASAAAYAAATRDAIASSPIPVPVAGAPVVDTRPTTTPTITPAGPVQADTAVSQPAASRGWNDAWNTRFHTLLSAMGTPEAEIQQQLQAAATSTLDDAELHDMAERMQTSIGAFTPAWKAQFEQLFDDLDVTPEQRRQSLQHLATSGATDAQLQSIFDGMQAQRPAWNASWAAKFAKLDLPKELVKQLKAGKPNAATLQQQLDRLTEMRAAYKKDGRLKKLQDANATAAEQWGVMTQGLKGKEFDKVQDQIRSSHVPVWKRIASFAVNLIPGAFALEYVFGGDPITGDKVDRTNPLNIIGAVASGFAAFTAIRGAVGIVQGLVAGSKAIQATQAIAGVSNLAEAVSAAGSASKIGAGTMQAIEGLNLVDKLSKPLRLLDYAKAATPFLNKFGEAGRLAQFGAGYSQTMQLAAGAAALTKTAGGVVIDPAVHDAVLSTMKNGGSVRDALGHVAQAGSHQANLPGAIARNGEAVLSNSAVAKLVGNNGIIGTTSAWQLNPFKNQSTVDVATRARGYTPPTAASGVNVLRTGTGVNLATKGGLAQVIGSSQAASIEAVGGASTAFGRGAIAATGVSDASVAANGLQTSLVAKSAETLGAAGNNAATSLGRLSASNRAAAAAVKTVEHTGDSGRQLVSYVAGMPSRSRLIVPGLTFGIATGSAGSQLEPAWKGVQEDPGVLIGKSKYAADNEKAHAAAVEEQRRFEQQYARQQADDSAQAQPPPQEQQATPSQ